MQHDFLFYNNTYCTSPRYSHKRWMDTTAPLGDATCMSKRDDIIKASILPFKENVRSFGSLVGSIRR